MILVTENDLPFDSIPEWLALELDGILVPFFIESGRQRGSMSLQVKFEGIDTIERAREMQGVKVFVSEEFVNVDSVGDMGWKMLVGFHVNDGAHGYIGIVDAVDDSTANILLRIRNGEDTYLIPANEEWITELDMDAGNISMMLPEGLMDL